MKLQESYKYSREQNGDYRHADEARDEHFGHYLGGNIVSLVALFGAYVDSLGGYQHINREAGKGVEDYRVAHEERLLENLACKQSHESHGYGRKDDERCRYADNGCDAVCAGACEGLEQSHHKHGHNEAVGARLMEGVRLNELKLVRGEAEQQADNIHRDIALCHIIYPVSGESDKCEL